MTKTTKRASFEELLSFCQKVRAAGGGNPLDALMPAVPQDSSQCLIAKNLNFNCNVSGSPGNYDGWAMYFDKDNADVAKKISEALELELVYSPYGPGAHCVILPPEIGQVAADFDDWMDNIEVVEYEVSYPEEEDIDAIEYEERNVFYGDDEEFKAFLPYIEASVKEAYEGGIFNYKGELIL